VTLFVQGRARFIMQSAPSRSCSEKPYSDYPTSGKVDTFCDGLMKEGKALFEAGLKVSRENIPIYTTVDGGGNPNPQGIHFLRICTKDNRLEPFYCLWQPASLQHYASDGSQRKSPLLIHTPGYAGTISSHPDLQAEGYNILHVNPLGLNTPKGFDNSKMTPLSEEVLETFEAKLQAKPKSQVHQLYRNVRKTGVPSVLFDTIKTSGNDGYRDWLLCCLVGMFWARKQKSVDSKRVGTFGTSQGGGGSLLLASILAREGFLKCVAADQPFLTDFKTSLRLTDAEHPVTAEFKHILGSGKVIQHGEQLSQLYNELGLYDSLSHAHRLSMPVLLTSGTNDFTCPAEAIFNLYTRLPNTRSLTEETGRGHGGMVPFHRIALAWFKAYL
jgi:hypothetical protein